ncbi:MAG: molybdate ABC transporter substrate-binding protein [Gammaproteobacteria bacterium]|nr:molybdate ABC transporter substrate-binding protein [Gammaproteobacteria bacterium]
MSPWSCLLALSLLSLPLACRADTLRVAVAANFAAPMKALAADFQRASGHRLELSTGATGKFYAQILHGAPFELLLAADSATPEKLEQGGKAVPGTRQTYALGRLALWSAKPGYVDGEGRILEGGIFQHLALANPKLAPYGAAARAVLEKRGLWQGLQAKLVMGENIAQAHQFVLTGNAELGFVALAQIERDGRLTGGSAWVIPEDQHAPLRQDAVLLKDGPAGRAFLAYLRSAAARKLIAGFGYGLP